MLSPSGITVPMQVAMIQVFGARVSHALSVSHFFYFGNTLIYNILQTIVLRVDLKPDKLLQVTTY
jgi:hypothetical protein